MKIIFILQQIHHRFSWVNFLIYSNLSHLHNSISFIPDKFGLFHDSSSLSQLLFYSFFCLSFLYFYFFILFIYFGF